MKKPLLALLPLLTLAAHAQTWTAKKFVFKNPGPATQAQLETAAGLHAGPVNNESLTAAAQRLADTGFYDNVNVATEGPTSGLTIIFNLKPADPAGFLPTGFENFVWLNQKEIDDAIRAKIPVYNGTLPEAGPQADTAAEALSAALAAKHVADVVTPTGVALPVTFKVEHETFEPTLDHPLRVIDFRIVNPAPVVQNIHLQGVTPDLVPLLQKSVNRTAHTFYNEGKGGTLTQELILAPLLDAGYAQAVLAHMTMEIGAPANGRVPLVLTTTLAPGAIFKVSAIHFAGAPLLSADAFAQAAKLHPGDIASRKALDDTLKPLDDAYRAQGYQDVIVHAEPEFDAPAATVAYTVTVTPGAQYRLATVTAEGLDAAAKADFDKYFKLHQGDLFDAPYVSKFISNNTALSSLARYTGAWKATSHPDTHTVDLAIRFFPGSPDGRTTTVTVH